MQKKNNVVQIGLTAIVVIFLLCSSLIWAETQSDSETGNGSTVIITGPVQVPPGHPYDIILNASTEASIFQWSFYVDGEFWDGRGFTFGQTLTKTYLFTETEEGSHTYLFRFRGIAGAHGFPPYTEVSITVNISAQPPAAPSNLIATAVSPSQINLTWQDNSDNEDGFIIERKSHCYEQFSPVATVNENTYSYSDSNLQDATIYYYRVKAFNRAGESDYSNMCAAVTFAHMPTVAETIDLLNHYYQQSAFNNYGVYNSLYAKLTNAQYSISTNNYHSALGQLNAAVNQLNALNDNVIDPDSRASLLESTQGLIDYLIFTSDLPTTVNLYLSEEPCASQAIIGSADGVKTTLTGGLSVRLEPTANPNIASFTIITSSYIGTPLEINGVNFGTLYFTQDPYNSSTGTVNLTNGSITMVEHLLVTSSYLAEIGLSPIALEVPQTGTVAMKSGGELVVYTVGCGILPSYLPIIGGNNFLLSIKHSNKKTTPQPKIEWSVTLTDTFLGDITITKTDGTVIIHFIETCSTVKLAPITTTPPITFTIDSAIATITGTFFQGESEGNGADVNSYVDKDGNPTTTPTPARFYGKAVVIDVISSTGVGVVPCTIDFIQFISKTVVLNGESWDYPWEVDGPTSEQDPTYYGVRPTSPTGTTIMPDTPGLPVPKGPDGKPTDKGLAGKTLKVIYKFNTWIILKCPDRYEVLGYFEWGFTVEITFDKNGKVTKAGAVVKPTPVKWNGGPPQEGDGGAGDRYYDLLKPYHDKGWPQPKK